MKLFLILFLTSIALAQTNSVTAREYYDELYKVGGLDNFADAYVCFREDDVPTFFLLADSNAIKDLLTSSGGTKDLSLKSRKELEKGFLIVRLYHKGIAHEREFFEPDNHGNWVEKFESTSPSKPKDLTVQLQVNWDTLRYTRSVSVTGLAVPRSESGKCETVKPDIRQHGAPETRKSR